MAPRICAVILLFGHWAKASLYARYNLSFALRGQRCRGLSQFAFQPIFSLTIHVQIAPLRNLVIIYLPPTGVINWRDVP